MEELVRKMKSENLPLLDEAGDDDVEGNGPAGPRAQSPAGADAAE
jgi:hypothetical protein